MVFAGAAKSCHRACGYGSSGVDYESFRKLKRLRTQPDVDGVFASYEVVQSQARDLVRP